MGKKLLVLALTLFMLLGVFGLTGCEQAINEEEHIQRITERVQSRFFADGSEYAELYADFSVELLYNAKDEPAYFMVEFEPDGFLYGIIDKDNYYYSDGRYSTDPGTGERQYDEYGGSFYRGSGWQEIGQGWYAPETFEYTWYTPLSGSTYVLGYYGDKVNFYFKSHFKIAEVEEERKYISFGFEVGSQWLSTIIPLVKCDNDYVCVISGQKYESEWFNKASKTKITNAQKNAFVQL